MTSSGESMTTFLTLAEALAEVERAQRELDEERTQRQKLEDELKDARRLEALGRMPMRSAFTAS